MTSVTGILFFWCAFLLVLLIVLIVLSKRRTIVNILLRRNAKIVLFLVEEGKSINDPAYMKTIDLNMRDKEIIAKVQDFMKDIGINMAQVSTDPGYKE